MTKVLKIRKEIFNDKYHKERDRLYSKLSKRGKFNYWILCKSLGNKEPYYIKNPRIAEIFGHTIDVVEEWHIDNGYFYIEVLPGFKTKEGEEYEKQT